MRAVWEVLSPGRTPQYHVKHSHFWSVKLSFSQQLTGKQQNKILVSTTPTTHPPSFPSLFRNKIVQTQIVCAGTQLAPLLALLRWPTWYQHHAECLIVLCIDYYKAITCLLLNWDWIWRTNFVWKLYFSPRLRLFQFTSVCLPSSVSMFCPPMFKLNMDWCHSSCF